jgi:2-polyprenyl-3-methyl-5-hydroxy-6-metoxy-1,4-benzoquinol methylase
VTYPPEDADVETATAAYARRFSSSSGRWMLQRQLSVTLDLLRDKAPTTILDVGGGHGQLAPELARRGHRTTVLVSSNKAISNALRPALDSGAVRLVVGDLRAPPVEPRSFEVVLCFRLLAHAYDLPGLIDGLTRPAERTVIVDYATTRSFNAAAEFFFAAKKKIEHNTRPFHVLRDLEVQHAFLERGCRLRERRPQFFWPMALHRALRLSLLARGLELPAAALGLRSLFGSPVVARFDRV